MNEKTIHDFGSDADPNHVILVSVPGKGNRQIIDTTYEVRVAEYAEWITKGNFSNGYTARAFGQGYIKALQDCGQSPT